MTFCLAIAIPVGVIFPLIEVDVFGKNEKYFERLMYALIVVGGVFILCWFLKVAFK